MLSFNKDCYFLNIIEPLCFEVIYQSNCLSQNEYDFCFVEIKKLDERL